MTKAIALFLTAYIFSIGVQAQEQKPKWLTDEKIEQVKKTGIDPAADLSLKANYRWEYTSSKAIRVGTFNCPKGTVVSISRNVILAKSPKESMCKGPKGEKQESLKLLPDGSAEIF